MRILLDENFPIQLYRRLQHAGYLAEHIIALGLRGLPDSDIRRRLTAEADLLFLTQDVEFADLPPDAAATIVISRVPQAIPIAERVELWLHGIEELHQRPIRGQLFEILPDGRVVPWRV